MTSSRESRIQCFLEQQTKCTVFATRPPQTAHNIRHVGETFGLTFLSTSNTCLRPSVTEKECWLLPLLQGTVGRVLNYCMCTVCCCCKSVILWRWQPAKGFRVHMRDTGFFREKGCGWCLCNAVIFVVASSTLGDLYCFAWAPQKECTGSHLV